MLSCWSAMRYLHSGPCLAKHVQHSPSELSLALCSSSYTYYARSHSPLLTRVASGVNAPSRAPYK